MKKIVSLLFVAVILCTCFSGLALTSAAEEISVWDGVVPEANAGYYFEEKGTVDDPYLIESAAEFAQFAANVRANNADTCYKGKHFKLTVDIDLNNHPWYPIGGGTKNSNIEPAEIEKTYFAGHFDGDCHIIKNLNLATTDKEGNKIHKLGLFGYIAGGSIRNIGIESGNIILSTNTRVGALCGAARYGYVIMNCYNKANILAVSHVDVATYIGGIVGWSQDAPTGNPERFDNGVIADEKMISHCYNLGNITFTDRGEHEFAIGGIAGRHIIGNPVFENVYSICDIKVTFASNRSAITGEKGNAFIGGVAGAFYGTQYCEGVYSKCSIKYAEDSTLPMTSNFGLVFGAAGMEGSGEDVQFVLPEDSVVRTSNSERLYNAANREFPAFMPETPVDDIEIPLVENSTFMLKAEEAVWGDVKPQNPGKTESTEKEDNKNTETTVEDTKPVVDTEGQSTEEESGCKSSVGGGIAAILAVAGVSAVVAVKRRGKRSSC